MEKIKPEVIGWEQVEFMGARYFTSQIPLSDGEFFYKSTRDFKRSGIKSKFRPVYKKH